ncbi:hypothetical protein ALC57_13882, partial [Trachymyrmex cornetzi]
ICIIYCACVLFSQNSMSARFLQALLEHYPLLRFRFPKDCCCDYDKSRCPTTTSITTTTTTTLGSLISLGSGCIGGDNVITTTLGPLLPLGASSGEEKDQAVAATVARGCEGGRRTCLHLFQRARQWVVTSRVGRHGNLLGLPKRGSIVLPVKTARDPDPTGSPMHMDSQLRRVVAEWRKRGREDSSSLERKSSVLASLKSRRPRAQRDPEAPPERMFHVLRAARVPAFAGTGASLPKTCINIKHFSMKYMRHGSAPCCRGGERLEPVQRRLVTLATREGVVFGVETREGGSAKTTLLFSCVHVPEKQKGHAVRATVHDKASVVLAGCKTIKLFTVKRELTSGQLLASGKSGGEVGKPRQFEAIGRNVT